MKIDYVYIDPDGDYYLAMFVDNKLVIDGDEYHNDIKAYTNGYEEAMRKYLRVEECDIYHAEHTDCEYMNFKADEELDRYLSRLGAEGFKISKIISYRD